MDKYSLFKKFIFGYILSIVLFFIVLNDNFYLGFIMANLSYQFVIPYLIKRELKDKKLKMRKINIMYACSKSRKLIFRANIILFFLFSLYISYLMNADIIKSIYYFLIVYIFSLILTYLFSLKKSICINMMYKYND